SFEKINYTDTALALGVEGRLPLTHKLSLLASAEVEQQLTGDNPTYTVSMPFVGGFSKTAKITKTRGRVQTGLSYNINPALSVSF
ncbi:autotransporter domain-containing protein, partial [Pasteurella atlantica]|nr:autotransporter domain-containing protein [Pasteurella atlantica]